MSQIEFVRLDGRAVRVTSLQTDPESGDRHLVIIARGSRAAQELAELAAKSQMVLEVPDEPERTVFVAGTDLRSTGEYEQMMTRLRLTLADAPQPEPAESETQLDRIERKLDEVLRLLGR